MIFFSSNTIVLPSLIIDLGLILITASIAVLIFKRLKQPLVLGYLVAGFLAGTNFHFFPTIENTNRISIWAEIGVIFLLFGLGLEFSLKKLAKIGNTAAITAITQITFMVFIGYYVGQLMGWDSMNSIFLGVILSISSTTIIVKAFDELGMKNQKFAGNVIGSLIVQDIVAILMMVLLSTIAVSNQFSGTDLFYAVLKLFFFLIIWFIGGIFFIPTLLSKIKNIVTDEMLLIISLALCLIMVIFAANVGFSPALGAFIMGSVISETTQSAHIEKLIKPVKDLFGAIFFVSVGMLINPSTLVAYAFPIVIITLVIILGQSFSSTIGSLLSGQPLKQSIQSGMSLSQIGEFSFIIATLGMALNVTEDFLYPVVVAVSAITTFTTPFMIKWSVPVSEYLEKKLPKKWMQKIEIYSANTQSIKPTNRWRSLIKENVVNLVINTTIIIALVFLSKKIIAPLLNTIPLGNIITALLTILIISPFLWAVAFKKIQKNTIQELFSKRKYRGPIALMFSVRIIIGLFLIGFVINSLVSTIVAFLAFIAAVLYYIIFPKQLNAQYHYLEKHFLTNFNIDKNKKKIRKQENKLTPWDGHMAYFTIEPESDICGKKIHEMAFRERFGINIAYIKRGNDTIISVPNKEVALFPYDELCVIGTDSQIVVFREFLTSQIKKEESKETEQDIVLWKLELTTLAFCGKSIIDSNIKAHTQSIVVGVERNEKRILNPQPDFKLQKGDTLWIVGNKQKITEALHLIE